MAAGTMEEAATTAEVVTMGAAAEVRIVLRFGDSVVARAGAVLRAVLLELARHRISGIRSVPTKVLCILSI